MPRIYPLMFSLDNDEVLNSRLNEKILLNSFRVNIIVTGDDNSQLHPYEEVMAVTFILAM